MVGMAARDRVVVMVVGGSGLVLGGVVV